MAVGAANYRPRRGYPAGAFYGSTLPPGPFRDGIVRLVKSTNGSEAGRSHGRVYAGLVLTMVFWGSAFATSKMLVLEVRPRWGGSPVSASAPC